MKFQVAKISYDFPDGVKGVGFLGTEENSYFLVSKSFASDEKEKRPHLEMNDQINSGYGEVEIREFGNGRIVLKVGEELAHKVGCGEIVELFHQIPEREKKALESRLGEIL